VLYSVGQFDDDGGQFSPGSALGFDVLAMVVSGFLHEVG